MGGVNKNFEEFMIRKILQNYNLLKLLIGDFNINFKIEEYLFKNIINNQ